MRPRLLFLFGLLFLGALACGTPKEAQQADLASRREAEFTELSQQAGMVTPSYLPRQTTASLPDAPALQDLPVPNP